MIDITVTGELNSEQRRLMVQRQNAVAANAILKCGGFEWFVAQCEAKAAALDKLITDMHHKADPRDEDRWRGAAESFRAMPRMIRNAPVKFNQKAAEANARAARQQGDQQ